MKTIRQVKYSPRQTQFSTAGYTNIVDFNIESGSYDLSNSWVNINCQVDAKSTEATPSGDTACVHGSTILVKDDADGFSEIVDNIHDAIVKNVELSSGNKGVFETSINHNAYKANKNALICDDEDNQNEEHASTVACKSKGLIQNGPINLLNGIGTSYSTVRACNIRLPLKNLSRCWFHAQLELASNVNRSNLHTMSMSDHVVTHPISPNQFLIRLANRLNTPHSGCWVLRSVSTTV